VQYMVSLTSCISLVIPISPFLRQVYRFKTIIIKCCKRCMFSRIMTWYLYSRTQMPKEDIYRQGFITAAALLLISFLHCKLFMWMYSFFVRFVSTLILHYLSVFSLMEYGVYFDRTYLILRHLKCVDFFFAWQDMIKRNDMLIKIIPEIHHKLSINSKATISPRTT
jgi:hypothetical protein